MFIFELIIYSLAFAEEVNNLIKDNGAISGPSRNSLLKSLEENRISIDEFLDMLFLTYRTQKSKKFEEQMDYIESEVPDEPHSGELYPT